MTPVVTMTALSAVSCVAAVAVFGTGVGVEILFGMLGPLVATTATWVAADRTYARKPERLTALLIAAFGAKLVFFGAYVTLAIAGLKLRPVPFVVSFTCYFIGLYSIEALWLRRLFAS